MDLLGDMKQGKVKDILRRSSRAVCGPQEREVVVKNVNVSSTKRLLKSKGFFIVGTGRAGPTITKIWFNPIGGF